MARGDMVVFDEAKAFMIDGGWESADVIKVAILDNTSTPAAADATPALGDYTQIGAAGSYSAGGETLDSLGNMITEAAGIMTFDDTGATVAWLQNASNDVDAYWALIYNDTDGSDLAIAFLDLGGPVDMSDVDLTITWNGSGIFTIA